MRTNADKKKAVVLRSKTTSEVMTFESRNDMMNYLGVNLGTLYKFLRGDERCRLNTKWEVVSK